MSTRQRRWRGRYLIGADGANSLVRRRLHTAVPGLALVAGDRRVRRRRARSREILVRFVRQPPGYVWSFPRADHLAIGICAPADRADAAELRGHLDRWLARQDAHARMRSMTPYCLADPVAAPRTRGPTACPRGRDGCSPATPPALVDPLTREGIYYALRSGELAAQALLGAGPESVPELCVRRAGRTGLGAGASARARGTFFSPLVTRLWIDVLRESPRVRSMALES